MGNRGGGTCSLEAYRDDGRQRINKQTSAELDGLGWWEMCSKQDDYRSILCLMSWHSVWLRVFEL